LAHIEIDGRADWYNALAEPAIQPGDWAVTHAHMVTQLISAEEARVMLDANAELDALLGASERDAGAGG
jgi:hypothetical protein